MTHTGAPIRSPADFSPETAQARREWRDISEEMKGGIYTREHSTQQGFHADLMQKSQASQTGES